MTPLQNILQRISLQWLLDLMWPLWNFVSDFYWVSVLPSISIWTTLLTSRASGSLFPVDEYVAILQISMSVLKIFLSHYDVIIILIQHTRGFLALTEFSFDEVVAMYGKLNNNCNCLEFSWANCRCVEWLLLVALIFLKIITRKVGISFPWGKSLCISSAWKSPPVTPILDNKRLQCRS